MSPPRMVPRTVGLWGVLALLGGILVAPSLLPLDPFGSPDPAALRLLPPGSRVPALVRRDGRIVPVAGRGAAGAGIAGGWRVEGEEVLYRRGPRWRRLPLRDLEVGPDGRPVVRTLWYPLGTDRLGRDLAARLLAGGRTSLLIGMGSVAGAALLGAVIGLGGALAGGFVDAALSRLGDTLLAFPRVVLVMALAATVRTGPVGLTLLIAATGWPSLARLVRADARALARSEMVVAARASGAGPARIAFRHLLPHALSTLAVAAGLRIGPFVLLEASLSFLGFGVPLPLPSWGNILNEGRDVLFEAWWVTTFPGALLGLTVIALNAAADRLRTRLEVRRG